MEIRISRGMILETGNSYIRVDFYKTDEAYFNPEEHEDEIWNCCCTFDANDPTKPNELSIVDRLLSIVETSVNSCLKASEHEPNKAIINEVSAHHVVCAHCRKSHFGKQTYNDWLKDYICEECEIEIEMGKI